MIQRLKDQQGITLTETMATVAIMSIAMISIYLGILYAEKQMQRNYHDRVAILAASGEVEWQFYYKETYKTFELFSGRPVVLDNLARGRTLNGTMSVKATDTYESPFGVMVPFTIVEATVLWKEPGDEANRRIVVREDFY